MSGREETLAGFAELQLTHLTPDGQPLLDDPRAIAREMREYLSAVQDTVRALFDGVLDQIDHRALQQGKHFAELDLTQRERVLDGLWGDPLLHDLVSLVARLGWLVIYSREPARRHIGFSLPTPRPPIDVPMPEPASLDHQYDVCIVGSGAGGALVAARLAERGVRVLVVDDGPWISPRDLAVRDDRALTSLYRNAAIQPALPHLDAVLRPGGFAFINVLQARVFGGGPTINNAIHLPIARERHQQWQTDFDFPIDWDELNAALGRVRGELGIDSDSARVGRGQRTMAFVESARRLGLDVKDLDVSIFDCAGCGGCNVGCRFGLKTGGLHGHRPNGPLSYLERARAAQAGFRSQVRALNFRAGLFSRRVRSLAARDLAAGRDVSIRADRFVLAAGPIASSKLLLRSVFQISSPVGQKISANVVLPVFAILPKRVADLPHPGPDPPPDPGLQMCVYVDQGGRLLETWFHYPASLAIALPEWLGPHVRIMREYGRLAVCGVVVPTGNRGVIGPMGELVLSLSGEELGQMVEGVLSVADVFFAAGAETVTLASRRPIYLRRDHQDQDKTLLRQSIRGPGDLTLGTAHPQGGNAIGWQKSKSVVSPGFSLYDFPNLFVADASLFPAGCGVNPQMTTMALAHLAADRLLAG